ncbi:MAG: hypothetical protein J2P53_01145 [Bradyrhizobiaceae bacterium]|nr:hypothetical protein [Bradyrhizobiaceae bacterium]
MSSEAGNRRRRYFTTYSGVDLPFRLVNEIAPEALSNRNTYICGYFDAAGRMTGFEKFVYGGVELTHRYEYHGNGALQRVEILMSDEDAMIKCFDEQGAEVADHDGAEPDSLWIAGPQ